jgi:hypothetical protein
LGQTRAFRLCGSSLLSLRKRRDRLEEFDSRTERKTEFAEVIFLQIAKNGLVDRIVAERRQIAFESQAPQPIPEVHDGAQSPSWSPGHI